MKIGYARVSTKDQNLDLQIDALKKYGCERIYQEKISGTKNNRPELNSMLENVRNNDIIVIWKLDRLGRSLKDLVELVNKLKEKNIGLVSLNDFIDTTSAVGNLTFNFFASLAQFEKDVTRERTMAGLEAARARGRKGGRPKGLSPEAEAKTAEILYKSKNLSIEEILKQLNISKGTLYSYLRYRQVNLK